MRLTYTCAAVLALVAACSESDAPRTAGSLMVRLREAGDVGPFQALVEGRGAQAVRCMELQPTCVIEVDDVAGWQAWLSTEPRVVEVFFDVPVPVDGARGDTALVGDGRGTAACPSQTELTQLGLETAWQTVRGKLAGPVAIADGGFRETHEEYGARIAYAYNYGEQRPGAPVSAGVGVPGHGTFIAGLVAGDPNNRRGRAGVLPEGRLHLMRIANAAGQFNYSYAIAALDALAANPRGVRVVNYSIATGEASQPLRDAIDRLAAAGILFVTAAGNCGSANCAYADNDVTPWYPGAWNSEHIVAVAGVDARDQFNPWSRYGKTTIDVAAPGVNLCSAWHTGDAHYETMSGTSYAAPLVAGVAALVTEAHPALTPVEVARLLRATSRRVAGLTDKVRSGGVVNAGRAIAAPMPRQNVSRRLQLSPRGTLDVQLSNAAAAGTACVIVEHAPELVVAAARPVGALACWRRQSAGLGQTLTLPDQGQVTAQGYALTQFCGELAAHSTVTLALEVAATAVRSSPRLSIRTSMKSAAVSYVNAPYVRVGETPTPDQSGFASTVVATTVNTSTVAPTTCGDVR